MIAYNGTFGDPGVLVVSGTGNRILSNSIYSNSGLGIDLFPFEPTPNDPGDADTGANELQNFPMLTSASTGGGSTMAQGTFNSHPSTTYDLQFFASPQCDPSGFGEGKSFLGDRFVTTDAAGNATFSFSFGGGNAGDVVTSTATDPNGNTSEFSNCATSQALATGSVTMLSPPTATNTVGTSHTVTATVTSMSAPIQPLAGVIVYFTVTGSVQTSGQCTTDQSGQCSFTYQGPQLPGADAITAYADANGNGVEEVNEVPGAASKAWLLPASTPGKIGGAGEAPALDGSIAFGFKAESGSSGIKGDCDVVDLASHVQIECTSITTLIVAGTHATFSGQATINGVVTNYRIDVDDLGKPGAGRDTFKIQTDSGFVAGGILTEGDIKVHD